MVGTRGWKRSFEGLILFSGWASGEGAKGVVEGIKEFGENGKVEVLEEGVVGWGFAFVWVLAVVAMADGLHSGIYNTYTYQNHTRNARNV